MSTPANDSTKEPAAADGTAEQKPVETSTESSPPAKRSRIIHDTDPVAIILPYPFPGEAPADGE